MAKKLKMFPEVKTFRGQSCRLTKQSEVAYFFLHFIFFLVIPHKKATCQRMKRLFFFMPQTNTKLISLLNNYTQNNNLMMSVLFHRVQCYFRIVVGLEVWRELGVLVMGWDELWTGKQLSRERRFLWFLVHVGTRQKSSLFWTRNLFVGFLLVLSSLEVGLSGWVALALRAGSTVELRPRS